MPALLSSLHCNESRADANERGDSGEQAALATMPLASTRVFSTSTSQPGAVRVARGSLELLALYGTCRTRWLSSARRTADPVDESAIARHFHTHSHTALDVGGLSRRCSPTAAAAAGTCRTSSPHRPCSRTRQRTGCSAHCRTSGRCSGRHAEAWRWSALRRRECSTCGSCRTAPARGARERRHHAGPGAQPCTMSGRRRRGRWMACAKEHRPR